MMARRIIGTMKSASRVGLLLLIAFAACGKNGKPPLPCEKVTSYDECDRLSHCSAVRFSVSEDHTGPVWACEPKGHR